MALTHLFANRCKSLDSGCRLMFFKCRLMRSKSGDDLCIPDADLCVANLSAAHADVCVPNQMPAHVFWMPTYVFHFGCRLMCCTSLDSNLVLTHISLSLIAVMIWPCLTYRSRADADVFGRDSAQDLQMDGSTPSFDRWLCKFVPRTGAPRS